MRSRSRSSMTKHSGALISSRLMPPKEGPRSRTALTNASTSFGIDLEIDGIDVGEALEQRGLAFHHRLRRERAEIAKPEDRGAVGDDGDHVAARRIIVRRGRILGDGEHRRGDARRISERQVALRRHRLGGDDGELAGPAARMKQQRLLVRYRRALLSFRPIPAMSSAIFAPLLVATQHGEHSRSVAAFTSALP